MKGLLCALFILLMVISAPKAIAGPGQGITSFEIVNPRSEIIVYNILWVDHPYAKEHPKPYSIYGGGLKGNSATESGGHYGPGEYIVILEDEYGNILLKKEIWVGPNTSKVVIVAPEEEPGKSGAA